MREIAIQARSRGAAQQQKLPSTSFRLVGCSAEKSQPVRALSPNERPLAPEQLRTLHTAAAAAAAMLAASAMTLRTFILINEAWK
jgi:hypothetical protein